MSEPQSTVVVVVVVVRRRRRLRRRRFLPAIADSSSTSAACRTSACSCLSCIIPWKDLDQYNIIQHGCCFSSWSISKEAPRKALRRTRQEQQHVASFGMGGRGALFSKGSSWSESLSNLHSQHRPQSSPSQPSVHWNHWKKSWSWIWIQNWW